ncbi:MAG: RNA-binding S4 domain-containing protein [Halanaerobiaceae bacterium]|jgi:ribosome-associated protein|nr:RNA-binding S4 domain-containing protein [Halanaerobiaceae bacterium]
MQKIKINTDTIKMDQFLKWAEIVSTGGEAKLLIKNGKVKVNGVIDTRRGLKLKDGDIVEIIGKEEKYQVSR